MSTVDDKVDDSERQDGRRFALLLSVCPSVMIRIRNWTIRTNQCSCVEVTWLLRSQFQSLLQDMQPRYTYKKITTSHIFPFFQRLTGSGGPGGSGISSNPHSLNVIAGKPRADFPVCLRVEAIVAGDLGGDRRAFLGVLSSTLSRTDIDCTERVSELGKS